MKEYLAIFDLDGTLFDTSEVNYLSYKEALKSFGVDLSRDFFMGKCFGKHYMDFIPSLVTDSAQIELVHESKTLIYNNYLGNARVNTHLLRLIHCMRATYYTALVTTASNKNTFDLLNYFNCADCFDLIITQESIVNKKPDPEGFLKAMNHFGIDAEHTLIFEDSEVGIVAAKMAGATVFTAEQF